MFVGGPQVNTFLCGMPPDEASGGCAGCRAELLTCPKEVCYRHAVNVTWQTSASDPTGALYQDFMEAATDITCSNFVRDYANNPVDMIVKISEDSSLVTKGCRNFHCGVLENAIGKHADLVTASGVCTNVRGTKPTSTATSCPCSNLLPAITEIQVGNIRSVCGAYIDKRCKDWTPAPAWCGITTTTMLPNTTTGVGGQAMRRLVEGSWMASEESQAPARDCEGDRSNITLARKLQAAAAGTPSAAAELNNVLEPWTVGEWSKCTCYQQCIPGVQTRLVQCLATSCTIPEPARLMRCVCKHCATCSVVQRMFILAMLFFSNAGVAFLVYLSYLHATTVKEDSLIKISIVKKLIGMVCKNLPPIVRVLVMVNAGFICLIMVQTFVPGILGIRWMKDCFDSAELRLITWIVAGLVVFQLVLGRCAKKLTRKPPWLVSPDRANWPTPLKQIRYLFRAFGP